MRVYLPLILAFSLSACGGGSDGGGDPANPNTPTTPSGPVLEKLAIQNEQLFNCVSSGANKQGFIESYERIECTQPVTNLLGLDNFFRLKTLTLHSAGSLSGIEMNDKLENLRVNDSIGDKSLSPLRELSSLKVLNVNLSNFDNLTSLSNLTQLVHIHVQTSESDVVSSGLATLTNLESVSLIKGDDRDAEISSLQGLIGLTKLKELRLFSLPLVTDLDHLPASIEYINIEDSGIDTFINMNTLTKLRTMRLKNTQITNFTGISGLPALESLESDNNTLLSSFLGISNLPKLKHLSLNYTSGVRVTSLNGISNLPEVTNITFDNQDIQGSLAALLTLPKLETLSLFGNNNLTCAELNSVIAQVSVTSPDTCTP